MVTEESKSLEQKIDILLEESLNSKKERKRDNVLNKIDSLYNILVAIATFSLGILVSQHAFFFNRFSSSFALSIIGIILSLLASYSIGLRGMLTDSMEYRILSWGLLFSCLIYYLVTPFIALNVILNSTNPILLQSVKNAFAMGLMVSQVFISPIITRSLEKHICKLSGQKQFTGKMRTKIYLRIFYISFALFITAIFISFILANFLGLTPS